MSNNSYLYDYNFYKTALSCLMLILKFTFTSKEKCIFSDKK